MIWVERRETLDFLDWHYDQSRTNRDLESEPGIQGDPDECPLEIVKSPFGIRIFHPGDLLILELRCNHEHDASPYEAKRFRKKRENKPMCL
jgi:hypothetical protein